MIISNREKIFLDNCSADFNLEKEIYYRVKMLKQSLNRNNNPEEETPTCQLNHIFSNKNIWCLLNFNLIL